MASRAEGGRGPLAGVRVVQLAGLAPAPFACMLLADLGAEVVRVERPAVAATGYYTKPASDVLSRGQRSIAVDLKDPEGLALVLDLVSVSDVLVEGFRPGVTERLGLGPDECLGRNPGLVYGRITGWGQEGPYADAAGHDINYLALSGALHPIGRAGTPPVPPVNYAADFGGGGMLLALGVLAALLERQRSGRGQVVDAAMVDGSALFTALLHGLRSDGQWRDERGTNFLDGGSHYYEVYETADGGYVSVGAVEPQFYAELLARMGLDAAGLPDQNDAGAWPRMKQLMAETFRSRTRAEWCELLESTDACFAPVLALHEAPLHPHNTARGTFVDVGGVVQPAPAPRFSRSVAPVPEPAVHPGRDTDAVLRELGIDGERIAKLRSRGAVA